jgi:hypothetical protein
LKRYASWAGQVLHAVVFLTLVGGFLAYVTGTIQEDQQERQIAAQLQLFGLHFEDCPVASEAEIADQALPSCLVSPPLALYQELRQARTPADVL